MRRVGVSFTEAQKEQIRVLDMTGRKAEAQEIVDAGIISLNNFLADDELEDRPALVQGGITLE